MPRYSCAKKSKRLSTCGVMQRSKHGREPYDILTIVSDSPIIRIIKVTQEQPRLHDGHPVCAGANVQHPKLSTHFSAEGSRAAMASMAAVKPNAESLSDIYSTGMEATMCMCHELQLTDTIYMCLTNGQKGV